MVSSGNNCPSGPRMTSSRRSNTFLELSRYLRLAYQESCKMLAMLAGHAEFMGGRSLFLTTCSNNWGTD
eukprot:scaffold610302_cov122-Attheya_sp.AAC.1